MIIPLVLGMLLLGGLMISVVYWQSGGWVNEISSLIRDIEMTTLSSESVLGAGLARSALSTFILDVKNLASYAALALKTGPEFNIVRPYPSYFASKLENDPPKPPQGQESLYSEYFNINVTTSSQLTSFAAAQSNTILDNILRPLKIDKEVVENVYFGFEDFGFRLYPYSYDSSGTYSANNFCSGPNLPASVQGKTGFIPSCRSWYRDAVTQSIGNVNDNFGPVVIGTPYISAATNRATITASQAVYIDGRLIGVAAVDVRLDHFLADFSKHSKFLHSGDTNRLNKRDIFANVTNIGSIEFKDNASLTDSYLASVNSATSSGNYSDITLNNENWKLSSAPVAGTDFYIVAMVPESEINSSSITLRSQTTTFSTVAVVIISLLLILATVVSFYASRAFALRVLNPVVDLSRILESLKKADFSAEIEETRGANREIGEIYKQFRYLIVALRFGNAAYYAGDLQKALQNYLAAEKIMIEFKNEKGLGICRNNEGNVYSQMKRYHEATTAFTFAVTNAIKLLEEEISEDNRTKWDEIIANRKMNLGSNYSILKNYPSAELNFNDSMDLFRRHDNALGLAQVSGNLAQMYLEQKLVDKAELLVEDAYGIVKKKVQPDAMQYTLMNKGLVCMAQGKKKEALSWFLYVLTRFPALISYVQQNCAQNAINLCYDNEIDKKEIADKLFEIGKRIFPTLTKPVVQTRRIYQTKNGTSVGNIGTSKLNHAKDLAFTLDVSYSMNGSKIETCRKSIDDFISKYTSDEDRVRMEKFGDSTWTVFDWMDATPANKATMIKHVYEGTQLAGWTAMWDALKETIIAINKLPPDDTRARWICALTDGGDNCSKANCSEILEMLKESPTISVIMIGVGSLSHKSELESLCAASRGGGMYISSDATVEAIEESFVTAAQMVTSFEFKVESL
ncbi:hypothetical protein HK098_008026 [Nowakowskiella sp. JEL0407]|nr:hypothetical protein HK098_008026 [Nowakowskiella sp. JEL0407]